MSDDALPIRSYSVCFNLERRIHKIDRWRIPLPHGVPFAGLGWGALVLLLVLVGSRLPLLGALLGALHPSMRYVALPVGVAWALVRWRIDGRAVHATGWAWVRYRLGPRRIAAFRPVPDQGQVTLGTIACVPDERGTALRPAVVRGPARVVLRYPVAMRERGPTLRVAARGGAPQWRGTEIDLRPGQRVVIER